MELLYKTTTGCDFRDLLLTLECTDPSPENSQDSVRSWFANEKLYDNLYNAQAIKLVIYDEDENAREELNFKGVNDIWNWFNIGNTPESSLWEIDPDLVFFVFQINPDPNNFVFEMTKSQSGPCDASGFLKVTCNIEPDCNTYKWWLEDATLQETPCGILYSKQSQDVKYEKAFWASKIQIITKQKTDLGSTFEIVFMLEAFSGVDAYNYFKTGLLQNPDPNGVVYANKLYRHPKIQSKIMSASSITLRVYNFEKTKVVSELVFSGTRNFESWFGFGNVKSSSLWEIKDLSDSSIGSFFTLAVPDIVNNAYLRKFFINDFYAGCDKDQGWLLIVSKEQDTFAPCFWERWWRHGSERVKNLDVEHQPPYILYATTGESQRLIETSEGGKIEILVQ